MVLRRICSEGRRAPQAGRDGRLRGSNGLDYPLASPVNTSLLWHHLPSTVRFLFWMHMVRILPRIHMVGIIIRILIRIHVVRILLRIHAEEEHGCAAEDRAEAPATLSQEG